MSEKKYLDFGARVLLPAVVCSLALWYSGLFGIQAAPLNILALLACYLSGYAALAYAGELKIPRTMGFYVLFVIVGLAGGLVAGGVLQSSPVLSLNSVLLPFTMAFVLPAIFEIIKERVANVQTE